MYGKMPNDTTTAVQHSPKTHIGLPTTSLLRRVALINIAVRTLGNDQVQHIPVSFITTYDLPRLLTVIAQQPCPHQCIFKQTTHQAPHLQLRMQLAETQTT